ncbi:MAG: bifunctional DNA-binding transcriptional regulator/O6-methylguanine-DNA methyltransferase Ada [Myxococcaceae bacterium]|nr:bifunctional DNA-binding transcriptional regulator/O6-methylguanine-DNA methyltransferase Ada [Myxococcaceae bacterium]
MATTTEDEARWTAVCARDVASDGAFVFAVKTTGVFCRPSCGARRPLRQNVSFFDSPGLAERAGFRACKRCRPLELPLRQARTALVARLCRLLERSEREPPLATLASIAKCSPSHLQRLFKAETGLSPKQYALAHRRVRLETSLRARSTVTEAVYEAGFSSSSRVYERATSTLGATPKRFRDGEARVRFTIADCSLGRVLVGVTELGLCAVWFGESDAALAAALRQRFVSVVRDDAGLARVVREAIATIDTGARSTLPLDIRGTAFQHRVWQAIARIPRGATRSYADLARRIGAPHSARAVAQACGANPLAVVVPCHRVIATNGGLGGYRWGVARKRTLLDAERAPARGASRT